MDLSAKQWVFKYLLNAQGSIILNPENFAEIWFNGFANVISDALDYYASMGEVSGRKIIPRFMLFGFLKGSHIQLLTSPLEAGCDPGRYHAPWL